jgi:hypothetical protein
MNQTRLARWLHLYPNAPTLAGSGDTSKPRSLGHFLCANGSSQGDLTLDLKHLKVALFTSSSKLPTGIVQTASVTEHKLTTTCCEELVHDPTEDPVVKQTTNLANVLKKNLLDAYLHHLSTGYLSHNQDHKKISGFTSKTFDTKYIYQQL